MPLRTRMARYSRPTVSIGAVGLTIAGYAVFSAHTSWQSPALRGFSVVLLTLLPGFLYLRFLRFRLRPLWIEYVYNLHRLGIDLPGNLPQPPKG